MPSLFHFLSLRDAAEKEEEKTVRQIFQSFRIPGGIEAENFIL